MSDRKLASVRRVAAIEPIEGADKIQIAVIDGWRVVTQKGWCVPGDLVAYFEVDSFLPVRPEYEFLRKGCFKSTKNLGDGFRLRTIKLRGQLSQGLIMPLMDVLGPPPPECIWDVSAYYEGDDLTQTLGVKLYEKPVPAQLAGRVRGNFPSFIRKTDQERAQNLGKWLRLAIENGDMFEATIKLDGSSMTAYVYEVPYETEGDDGDGGPIIRVGICSRNWDLEGPDKEGGGLDTFWTTAERLGLPDLLRAAKELTGKNFALQGELMGPGVQDNRENLTQTQFFLYDIWDIDEQRYMTPAERTYFLDEIDPNAVIAQVPHIRDVRLSDIAHRDSITADLQKFVDRPSLNKEVVAEGVVFKQLDKNFSFKMINNRYLLDEKEDDNNGC